MSANGVLRESWEVHCATCERPLLGLAHGRAKLDAASEAKHYGWRQTRGNLWVCSVCAALQPQAEGGEG